MLTPPWFWPFPLLKEVRELASALPFPKTADPDRLIDSSRVEALRGLEEF
jgi:hypothetical protein